MDSLDVIVALRLGREMVRQERRWKEESNRRKVHFEKVLGIDWFQFGSFVITKSFLNSK
jgi:hypothetical protein